MKRDLQELANSSYDVLIVGGGIYGACVAWEAASRGLSVALVEKGDFGSATSANSLKTIHGGLRYLQHADFKRMRESIKERKALLKIAPHLIHPLKILVPTYGHGLKGREAMSIALWLNDIVSFDRNYSIEDKSKHIAAGKVISKHDCLSQLPGLKAENLTGAASFTDAQVHNSERLTLAFLHSANAKGAQIANYVKVTGLLKSGDRVTGAVVRDEMSGQILDLHAQIVINTTGPWIHEVEALGQGTKSSSPLVKAINFIIPKIVDECAVGLVSQSRAHDQDAVIDKGGRFLFVVPWRDTTMVGTWYFPFLDDPDNLYVAESELETCISDFNAACPFTDISTRDIQYLHCGLLPSEGFSSETQDIQAAKHYRLVDHSQQNMPGLLTVSGVKYTTARDVAEKVVNQVGEILGKKIAASETSKTPIWGGHIDDMEAFLQQLRKELPQDLSTPELLEIGYNYGSIYSAALESKHTPLKHASKETILSSSIIYSIRKEMAYHLDDVLLRRTWLGSSGKPNESHISLCLDTMTRELGWDRTQQQSELERVERAYQKVCLTQQTKLKFSC